MTALVSNYGFHAPPTRTVFKILRQTAPYSSIFGCQIGVEQTTLGGSIGYLAVISKWKSYFPPYHMESSYFAKSIVIVIFSSSKPGTGSTLT